MTPEATATLSELTVRVSRAAGWVESPSEAAAHIESFGMTDRDAQEMYGMPDVFSLAQLVSARQRDDEPAMRGAWEEETRRRQADLDKHKPTATWRAIPKFFFRGVAFGLPMALMIFAILVLLYSLWAYYYFTVARATAIGVGTALSYLLAGGFTQAIGRRGLMYLQQGMFLLCLKVCALFVAAGVVMSVVVAAILYFFLLFFPVVSSVERNITLLYFFDLSILWLCLAVLYMMQREYLFSVAIALGIGVVYVLREYFQWNVVAAHQVGILSAAFFSLICAVGLLFFKHHKNKDPRLPLSHALPRITMLLASIAPYFLFGAMYFTLIFGDRIMAWTGRMPFRQSFIWFRTDYEVGENWALLGLLPALGALEYAVYRFSGFIKPRQIEYNLREVSSFRSWFLHFYRRQLVFYFVMAIVGGIAAYIGVRALTKPIPEVNILFNRVSIFVFIFATIGYMLSAFGLLNVSLFFWLSRPRLAILAITPALIVDALVGFILSRSIGYAWAVVGFTCGAAVFAIFSLVLALRILHNLDYYYYSSV